MVVSGFVPLPHPPNVPHRRRRAFVGSGSSPRLPHQPQPRRPRRQFVADDENVATLQLSLLPHGGDFSLLLSAQQVVQETSQNLLQAYGSQLQTHPLTTKSVTAGVLACLGDAIAQFRAQSKQEQADDDGDKKDMDGGDDESSSFYDWKRGLAFLMFGAAYTGAFQHVWFTYLGDHIADWGDMLGVWGPERAHFVPLDNVFASDEVWWSYFDLLAQLEHPPSSAALAMGKLAVNQFGMVPLVYMPLFFLLTGALGGLDVNQAWARMQSLYLPLLRRNYVFWLPTQFFQFFVLPPEWQIPFLSTASLVWTIILSSIGGTSQPAAPSQIVAYETAAESNTDIRNVPLEGQLQQQQVLQQQQDEEEEVLTIVQVEAGAANELTDEVRLVDVENALIPEPVSETVREVLTNRPLGAGAAGFSLGLLLSAAGDGALGALLAELIDQQVGSGVALATAIGTAIGLVTSSVTTNRDDNAGGDEENKRQGPTIPESADKNTKQNLTLDNDPDHDSGISNSTITVEKVGAGGFSLGLLVSSAADDGMLAETIQSVEMMDQEVGAGVALVTAVGTAIGLASASLATNTGKDENNMAQQEQQVPAIELAPDSSNDCEQNRGQRLNSTAEIKMNEEEESKVEMMSQG